jgi:hypothetical protein
MAAPSAARLLVSLLAAGLSLALGLGAVRLAPDGPPALPAGAAVALLAICAWLVAPSPFGGGTAWRRLLTPDPTRPARPGLLMAGAWTLGAALLSTVALSAVYGFDLDATGWRPATPREVFWHGLLGLFLAAFHGVFCLGWGMGEVLREARDAAGTSAAATLAAGLAAIAGGLLGVPLAAALVGIAAAAAATSVMAIVVLLGGRVWPVILGNAFAWTAPMLAVEVPSYAY